MPDVRLVTADEFRRTVFAYRIPNVEAERNKYLEKMLAHPVLRERISSLGIRYLLLLHGWTDSSKTKFDGFGAAPIGAIPYATWERRTELAVSVIDVVESRSLGELIALAEGKPHVFLIPLLPVPAFTEYEACKKIGTTVAEFFSGKAQAVSDPAKPETKSP